ncbi:MAG TPA: hypothetical protein DIT10_12805 [Chryseobacterium sp.]|nr:hypothetical protein [Chryseobacterium sp.]
MSAIGNLNDNFISVTINKVVLLDHMDIKNHIPLQLVERFTDEWSDNDKLTAVLNRKKKYVYYPVIFKSNLPTADNSNSFSLTIKNLKFTSFWNKNIDPIIACQQYNFLLLEKVRIIKKIL